ncbi:Rv3235 family protein [Gulosibacter macacae]|uniref:Rv3235 family protein n=1 Tax=Gulosibacter macacae TaxID=2488791 RepID=UPI001F1B8DE7|nr:Rv3235 family protein [Gulosibacter macacae]
MTSSAATQPDAANLARLQRTPAPMSVPVIPPPPRRSDDEHDGLDAPEHAALPDPDPLLHNLARSVVEALGGFREVEQIARWVAPEVFTALVQRSQHATRARAVRGVPVRRPNVRTRACVSQRIRPGVVEATVIVDLGPRVRAVAIRLEAFRGRWRAARVHVL